MKLVFIFFVFFLFLAHAAARQGCMFAGEVIEDGTQVKLEDHCFNCDDGQLDHCACDSSRFLLPTGTSSPPDPSSASVLENYF